MATVTVDIDKVLAAATARLEKTQAEMKACQDKQVGCSKCQKGDIIRGCIGCLKQVHAERYLEELLRADRAFLKGCQYAKGFGATEAHLTFEEVTRIFANSRVG